MRRIVKTAHKIELKLEIELDHTWTSGTIASKTNVAGAIEWALGIYAAAINMTVIC